METSPHIQTILSNLPDIPGIYQYLDKDEKIIYVGKAKNLKKRVSSYFNRDNLENGKTRLLVKNIVDIKFILTVTELDALLLENTLIKKYQPKYNVSLKDDKTYPWIVVTHEPFPRIFSTRRRIKGLGQYFGPYAHIKMMYTLLDLIKEMFPLRSCRLNLTPKSIAEKKFKVCLEYHIKNCQGPCEAKQSQENYIADINAVKLILKGNTSSVLKILKEQMNFHASNLRYELAMELKQKIDSLEQYQSKSMVVSSSIGNIDVFSFVNDADCAYVNYMGINDGAIINSLTIELKKKIDEKAEDLLLMGVIELRQRYESNSKEIVLPFMPEIKWEGVEFVVPIRGDKKQLLELSERNLEYYRKEKLRQESLVDPERHTNRIMELMKKELRLAAFPYRIDCFDNSNIQGAHAVSAMTVFVNGKPSKKDYRIFNVKTVEGPDDFATMEEVIYRRYKRVLEENKNEMPDLIVIDGGKGQLSAALESLDKLDVRGKVGIIGIAKKLEEIYFPGDSDPLYIDKKSETLRILQHIRDEAHRFGITHHRNKRSRETFKTELTFIKGISHKTAQALLSEFKSVARIREATLEELILVIGKSKSKLITDYFSNEL